MIDEEHCPLFWDIPGLVELYYKALNEERDRDQWLTDVRTRLRLVTTEDGLPPDTIEIKFVKHSTWDPRQFSVSTVTN